MTRKIRLDRTITTLNQKGDATDPKLLRFLSPLGWEHMDLTGDLTGESTWPRTNKTKPGKCRPLRRPTKP